MALKYLVVLLVLNVHSSYCMTKKERSEMRETVREMFLHAYNSYMTYAYPADELMPLNCKGRYRGSEPSRGDVDDILGNFSMTLIDSLDSLVILGEINKFEEAVKYVIDEVHFDNDIVVSTFETNIRVLGGLLGGHVAADVLKNDDLAMQWYNDELLDMAKEIGERLMPAFNTTTGIPYPKVNLKYGVSDPRSRTGHESATCTACAGTMIMEFGALSRLTGDPKFETAAHKAMKALWTYRSRSSDLVGTVINIHNGEWVRRDSGVGAGIDSYYEYCLKAYILLGEEDYLQRFNQHYKAVMRYINKDSLFLNVHMNNPSKRSVSYMDSLQAFWPGLQVLKGDLQSAIELHEVFYSVAKRHTFLPEAFTTSFEVHWGQHFLRPELVESTYFLYEATKDPYYLEVGKYIVENLNRYARVPCGFAAVKDVRTLSHENRMDSFLLSETLKYLYLLFTDKADLPINLHEFVFTTEAHILPLALSNWNGSSTQSNVYGSENLHDHSCPRSTKDDTMMSFAERIRQRTRQSKAGGSCPKVKQEQTFVKTKGAAPLLRAEQFIPGNKDHQQILRAMGITVTKTDDGKVQLMQDVTSADNSEMAAQGVTFMQSMIELAKFRSNDAEYLPRVVQILSAPYNGNIVLNAGPAQFGIDLGKRGMGVSAEVVLADPFNGCTELKNKEAADHRIVVMERGDCMFIDKVRVAESLGAVGAIIIDNNEGSSSESQPMFAMSGDGNSNDIKIPAVFLFHNEGQILQKSMQIVRINSHENLRVRLGEKAVKKDATGAVDFEGTTSEQELKQGKMNEPNSEQMKPGKSGKIEVDKLVNLLKNIVKQPGFEFLSESTKAAVMMGEMDTADQRERWLYDVIMENWRGGTGTGKSKSVEEILEKLQDGFFSLKLGKVSGSHAQSNAKHETGCQAEKTSEKFVNSIVQHGDKRKDSEIFVVGNVGKGKFSDMNIVVTTIQSDEGGSKTDKSDGELEKNIDEMRIYNLDGSMTLNDVLKDDSNKDGSRETEDKERNVFETITNSDSSLNKQDEPDKSTYCTHSQSGDKTSNSWDNSQNCQNGISKNSESRGDSLMNGKDDEEIVYNIIGSAKDESKNNDEYSSQKPANTNVNVIKDSAQIQDITSPNEDDDNPVNEDNDGNSRFTTNSNKNDLDRKSTSESSEDDRTFVTVSEELVEQDICGHEAGKEFRAKKQETISENVKLFGEEERETASMNTNKMSEQTRESDFEVRDRTIIKDLNNQINLDSDKESLEVPVDSRDITEEEYIED